MTSRVIRGCAAALLMPLALSAQGRRRHAAAPDPWAALLLPTHHTPAPTTAAITAGDLRTRLFIFADDSMQGRRVGTPGNVMAVEYLAREAQRIGLQPAGEGGTFFQSVTLPLEERVFDSTTTITVNGARLAPWVDYLPRDPGGAIRDVDRAPVVYGGDWRDSTTVISTAAAAGKLVVITSSETAAGNPNAIPDRQAVATHFATAAAIAVVGLESLPDSMVAAYHQPATQSHDDRAAPIYLYITRRTAAALLGGNPAGPRAGAVTGTVSGHLRYIMRKPNLPITEPMRNVVALLPGRDPQLRDEYIVIGAHNDHIGTVGSAAQLGMSTLDRAGAHDSLYVVNHLFRKSGANDPARPLTGAQRAEVNRIIRRIRARTHGRSARVDSVFNGADDGGSGSVSLLEIAQYLAAQPVKPRRSILLVWHVGEEAGLWGSTYFADHPTVPREAIVAELNLDMIGRGSRTDQTGRSIGGTALHGGPGYLQVVGARRLSTELGELVEAVNRDGHHGLNFDYSMDAGGHPQAPYCRSDHASYARQGIPVAFFTTGGHADYHEPTDEAQYVDYDRMVQVDIFIADLARRLGNLDHRIVVDHPRPDPDAACQQ